MPKRMMTMTDLILHHYQGSLFSEKIRLIMGFKGLTWHSVEIPPIMPRPKLMPLTGGYRRTPVMQVGADIFCDTHVMTEYLEQLHPQPPLHPEALQWSARSLTQKADTHLFRVVVALCFQPKAVETMLKGLGEDLARRFAEDRAELSKGSSGVTSMSPEVAQAELEAELAVLEQQLHVKRWVLGDAPSLADFGVYHCLWLLQNNPVVAGLLEPYPKVGAWMQTMAGFGQGVRREMSESEALRIGTESEPMPWTVASSHLPAGVSLGQAVTVAATDYGTNPIAGTLDYCTALTCGILREDPDAGQLRVHFPRSGFDIQPA